MGAVMNSLVNYMEADEVGTVVVVRSFSVLFSIIFLFHFTFIQFNLI